MMASTKWFVSRGMDLHGSPRIFCFTYAGGDPRTFLDWQSGLGADAELIAVCPPGRVHRASGRPQSIEELADGAAAAISAVTTDDDRPVYLFGHSLGGLVAFEVARRLRDLPALRHLVASGISAPSLLPSQRVRELAGLEGRDFAEALRFFGGLPPEVLADDDVLRLLLPGLIADFRMAVGYRYRAAAPLTVNVSIITGRDDPHVGPEQLRAWREECQYPPQYHWAEGGHFYFEDQPSAVIDLLSAVVRSDQHVELI
jgi:surfactin synthase thioesterase subunit